jgi:chemotaxis protein CheZ
MMNGEYFPVGANDSHASVMRHAELMSELQTLRAMMKPAAEISNDAISLFKKEISEAFQMKAELDAIQEAIQRTKLEIATLHGSSFETAQMARVTGELDAIVSGTETATQQILEAAEMIDDHALTIQSSAKTARVRGMGSEIQEKVVRIFEACNFQDLTGQRITKVVSTLTFIEDRIDRMIEIWGGMEKFRDITPDLPDAPEGDRALLNGPGLAGEEGRASQDDIDALFD